MNSVATINPNKTIRASMIRGKLFEMLVFADPYIGKDFESEESQFYQRTQKSPEAQELLYVLQNPRYFPNIYGETKGIKNPDALFLNLTSPQIEILGIGDAKLGIIDIGDLKQLTLFKKSVEIIAKVLNQYSYLDLEKQGFKALAARKYILGESKELITVVKNGWQQIVYVPRDRNIPNPYLVSFNQYYEILRRTLLDKKISTKTGKSKGEKHFKNILKFTRFVPAAFSIQEIVHMGRYLEDQVSVEI